MSADRALLRERPRDHSEESNRRAYAFLSELGDEEAIDAETAAKLDRSREEIGEDVPIEELRRRLGL